MWLGPRLTRQLGRKGLEWREERRRPPGAMITQGLAAGDAGAAFDLIEREPQRTLKVQLDFS